MAQECANYLASVYVRQFNGFIIATRCQDLTIGLKAVARTAMTLKRCSKGGFQIACKANRPVVLQKLLRIQDPLG